MLEFVRRIQSQRERYDERYMIYIIDDCHNHHYYHNHYHHYHLQISSEDEDRELILSEKAKQNLFIIGHKFISTIHIIYTIHDLQYLR